MMSDFFTDAGCSRRDAIRQLLGLAGVALAAPTPLDAQVQLTTGRVDLHHHFSHRHHC